MGVADLSMISRDCSAPDIDEYLLVAVSCALCWSFVVKAGIRTSGPVLIIEHSDGEAIHVFGSPGITMIAMRDGDEAGTSSEHRLCGLRWFDYDLTALRHQPAFLSKLSLALHQVLLLSGR